MEIDIEDLSQFTNIKSVTAPARISQILEIAKDTVFLTLRRLKLVNDFLPGQYIKLISGDVVRSYSIANARREDGTLDLYIKRVPGGLMSNYLFESARENDLLRIEGPFGTFGLRPSRSNRLAFLATGTGIAPLLSIIEGCDLSDMEVLLIWGDRRVENFFDLPSLPQNITLIRTLSREVVDGFESGYVQDILMSIWPDFDGIDVCACGSDAMVTSNKMLFLSWFE